MPPKTSKQHARCRVVGCINQKTAPPPGTSLFSVPKDASVFEKWVQLAGQEDLLHVPIKFLKKNLFYCPRHFKPEEYFCGPKLKKLKAPVAPSIFDESHKPLSDQQMEEWRKMKHYGALNERTSPQNVQDDCISSSSTPSVAMENCGQRSNAKPSGSSAHGTPQAEAGGISFGTESHQVHASPVSADDRKAIFFPVTFGDQMTFVPYLCTPAGNGAVASSQSGSGGNHNPNSTAVDLSRSTGSTQATASATEISTPRTPCNCSQESESLAMPLPTTSPKRKIVDNDNDTDFVVRKRRTDSGSSAKRFRRSVATVRKTNRKMLQDVGAGDVDVTPVKKILCEELRKAERQIKDLMQERDHLKALTQLENIDSLLEHVVSPHLRMFVRANIRNGPRRGEAGTTGRRWDLDDLLLALPIFKRSPKGYRYLAALFVLPAVRTLQRLLQRLPMSPGIQHDIIKHSAKKIKPNCKRDKCVILMFDEMFIKKRLIYNPVTGLIEGFADNGIRKRADGTKYRDRENVMSEHALVFMVQGLSRRYKEPIGFHFTGKTAKSSVLKDLIKEYVRALEAEGFHVLATVCDQGPTNRGALTKLMQATDNGRGATEGYFKVVDRKVRPLWDVPHLFKNLRNNFMRSRWIVWDNVRARYSDIAKACSLDNGILRCKKIPTVCLYPKGRALMKVKWAAKTLSRTTSAFLRTFGKISFMGRLKRFHGAIGTAKVIEDFDKLFDLNNGPSNRSERVEKRREDLTATSFHWKRWPKMIRKMDEMEFWTFNKEKGKVELRRPPSQEGWVQTMKNIRNLWHTLHDEYDFEFLNLRQLNQDPIENLFGVIRQHGATCDNPTVGHFVAALKTSIVTNLTSYKSYGGNVADDDGELMSDLKELLGSKETPVIEEPEEDAAADLELMNCLLADDTPVERGKQLLKNFFNDEDLGKSLSKEQIEQDLSDINKVMMLGPSHVAGYLGRKVTAKLKCEECKESLKAEDLLDDHAFTFEKEYNPDKPGQFYASANFNRLVASVQESVSSPIFVEKLLHLPNIKSKVKALIMMEDLSWLVCTKPDHFQVLQEKITDELSTLLLRTICKRECEKIKSKEEAVKKAREAEKQVSREERAKKQAAAATRRAAQEAAKVARKVKAQEVRERKKRAVQAIRENRKKLQEEKRLEKMCVKEMNRLEKMAQREGIALDASVPPRTPTRAEAVLAKSTNIWNITSSD